MRNVKVIFDMEKRIAEVVLDKQPLNICDTAYYKEIAEAFYKVDETEGLCAVILRSACKHFSAGGSLEEIQQCTSWENIEVIGGACVSCMEAIYNCKYPVIGAIHGKAIGAGCAMAACCDITIAAEDTTFSLPEITAGYIGASEFLQMILPRRLARYYVYTGDEITAGQMKAWGGIFDVVPREVLLERALEIAEKLQEKSPLALSYFKAAMNENDNERLREKYMHESTYTLKYSTSQDFKETYQAFKERRKPDYVGK